MGRVGPTPRCVEAYAPELVDARAYLDGSRAQEREQRPGAPFVRIGPRSIAGTALKTTVMYRELDHRGRRRCRVETYGR
jgi:hypothetical protein